ncbi:MAG: phage integrase N-terminal SAM-like domain-containing protein [Holophagales bacterium]|nr:phage integrase N-terminal SAM-like domain-containing protein [Holophagales bacterium]
MAHALRAKHYSLRTERAYVDWARRYILFHGKRHPSELGSDHVNRFLTHLAVHGKVAASTQNQALAGLLFLYGEVLKMPLPDTGGLVRAKKPRRIPTVLTREEVYQVLSRLDGPQKIAATLLYGAGLRLLEVLRLRVKDVDFGLGQLVVRDGKGQKDRVTMLPDAARGTLAIHISDVRLLHARDLAEGFGNVWLPDALARKAPGRRHRLELAVGLPRRLALARPALRPRDAPPPQRDRPPARRPQRRRRRRHRQTGQLPHPAPLLRDAPPRGRLRHQDHPGTAWTQRRQHDDDLHSRAQ